jgi:hypothetical protein
MTDDYTDPIEEVEPDGDPGTETPDPDEPSDDDDTA